jgi:hypothetical protein
MLLLIPPLISFRADQAQINQTGPSNNIYMVLGRISLLEVFPVDGKGHK